MKRKELNSRLNVNIEKETLQLLHRVKEFCGYQVNHFVNDTLKEQAKQMLKSRGIV